MNFKQTKSTQRTLQISTSLKTLLQLRESAMDEFVNGVKDVKSDWLAVLGRTLTPVFYRKMPLRLAKRLSAGFQDKELKHGIGIAG